MIKNITKSLLFTCLIMACEIGYSQINYAKIENYIKDCDVNIFEKKHDSKKNVMVIQTDSIGSDNFAIFTFEPFTSSIRINDYNRIDSFIRIRYSDIEILSSQRTDEDLYVLHWYMTKDKKGHYVSDRFVVLDYDHSLILMKYTSIMGNNPLNFDRFECVIKKIKQAVPSTWYSA